MSKKRGIWDAGMRLSGVLEWYKRTAGKYQQFVGRISNQLRMVGRENRFEVQPIMNVSHPLHADFSGKPIELREFTKLLRVGDRFRMFCDDGVLIAEKISQTQIEIIHAETMAELVH
jgi:hypothetical protein